MWTVRAFNSKGWVSKNFRERSGEPFTSRAISDIAYRVPGGSLSSAFSILRQEAEDASLSRNAIELWGREAESQDDELNWDSSFKVKAVENAIGLYSREE